MMEVYGQSLLASNGVSTKRRRSPLISSTNSFTQTAIPSINKTLRHNLSTVYRIDSSEDLPTSHESIFHAECFSNHESEDGGHGQGSPPTATPSDTRNESGCDENGRAQFLSPTFGNTPILYGHGTALQTIVEQKSSSIISTNSRHRSVSDNSTPNVSTPRILGHRGSFYLLPTVTLRSPRRRKSFSADDLVFIKRSYHEACISIERTARRPIHVEQIYAEPHVPLVPPLYRPSTPPGLPSWTAAQIAPTRNQPLRRTWTIRESSNGLRRFLGIERNDIELPSRVPIPSTTLQYSHFIQSGTRRSASNPLPRRRLPRFRPIRSGHGQGPLEEHPFLRASAAAADAKGDVAATVVAQANLAYETMLPQRTSSLAQSTNFRPNASQTPNTPRMVPGGGLGKRAQCPHRRGRITSLRSLYSRSEAASTRMDVVQQPRISPLLMTLRAQHRPLVGNIPAEGTAKTPKCWKCRASILTSRVDKAWLDGTEWCCWIFCGVQLNDLDDDRNVRPHSRILR